ncbi:interferon-induced transmembrane protein 10-like [Mauremys mutica]|uniref:interferon-induced transmembrane protein 10-like n=1 Tax=Mauremys mutica TaxID=74926 RepID=UPI001D15FA5F|nr:interferon-induced transmembrane protein 10-like [Mauremys mutica]
MGTLEEFSRLPKGQLQEEDPELQIPLWCPSGSSPHFPSSLSHVPVGLSRPVAAAELPRPALLPGISGAPCSPRSRVPRAAPGPGPQRGGLEQQRAAQQRLQGAGQPGSQVHLHRPREALPLQPPHRFVLWSLFSTFFCNVCCLGFMALVFSFKARDRKVLGDTNGAGSKGKTAKGLNITVLHLAFGNTSAPINADLGSSMDVGNMEEETNRVLQGT